MTDRLDKEHFRESVSRAALGSQPFTNGLPLMNNSKVAARGSDRFQSERVVLSREQIRILIPIVLGEPDSFEVAIGFMDGPAGPGLYAKPADGAGEPTPLFVVLLPETVAAGKAVGACA